MTGRCDSIGAACDFEVEFRHVIVERRGFNSSRMKHLLAPVFKDLKSKLGGGSVSICTDGGI